MKWFYQTLKEINDHDIDLKKSDYCGMVYKIDTINSIAIIQDALICFTKKPKNIQ